MKKLTIIEANDRARRAIKAFEEASEDYRRKAGRHVVPGLVVQGEPVPRPEALLNFAALMEIEEAWRKLEHAEAKLRDAYVGLAIAHYDYFVKDKVENQDKMR